MDPQYRLRQAADRLQKASQDIETASMAADRVPELKQLAVALASASHYLREAAQELDYSARGV